MDPSTVLELARQIGPILPDAYKRLTSTKPFYLSRKTNAKHPLVRRVQERLGEIGYAVDVDGIYGPSTQAAVVEHQVARGLNPDGVAGKETLSAILLGPSGKRSFFKR